MEHIDTSAILKRTGEMVRLAPLSALVAWLALAIPATLLSVVPEADGRLAFVSSLTAVFAQFILTGKVARRAGLMQAEGAAGRAGSYVLVSIISGLAILLGFLLLVLPGLYLFARWSLVVPLVVAEGATMGEALKGSWERTRGSVVPICLALVAIGSGLILSVGMDFYSTPDFGPAPLLPTLVSNLIGFASTALTWFLALAIYSFTAKEVAPDLEQVFA